MKKPMRIYADTSVFGGVFDDAFALPSRILFEQVRGNQFELISSALVVDELAAAPQRVRNFFLSFAELMHVRDIPREAVQLRDSYLEAGIVGTASLADAQHVALATVFDCWAIVSWNFRHIVHAQKIPFYNGVNQGQGYKAIAIHTPQEVIQYEETI